MSHVRDEGSPPGRSSLQYGELSELRGDDGEGIRGCIMPIYEYRCPKCGNSVEKLVRSFDAEVNCPVCGERMERLLSSFSIKLESGLPGTTCCGRTERCDTPPCSAEGTCWRG